VDSDDMDINVKALVGQIAAMFLVFALALFLPAGELQKVLSANNIIGAPIEMEDKIIVPITKMGVGFGTGSSHNSDKNVGGTTGGAGGGSGRFPCSRDNCRQRSLRT
jgi:hypothetical protein